MTDRVIQKHGYDIIVEETNATSMLYAMIENVSTHIESGDSFLETLKEALPSLTGYDFVTLTYYKTYVSPSNLAGYVLIRLHPVPPSTASNLDELKNVFIQADDEELGQTLIITMLASSDTELFEQIKEEAENIIATRVQQLRAL